MTTPKTTRTRTTKPKEPELLEVIKEMQAQIANLKAEPVKEMKPVAEKDNPFSGLGRQFQTMVSSIPWSSIIPWVLCGAVLYFWWQSQQANIEPDNKPKTSISAVLDAAYKADRLDRIAILKEIEGRSFKNDQDKLDWINSETDLRRQAAFREYLDRMAEAVYSQQTGKMASDLEAGR
jgi:hypothetical protein